MSRSYTFVFTDPPDPAASASFPLAPKNAPALLKKLRDKYSCRPCRGIPIRPEPNRKPSAKR
jgi:hypothetical protein